jgi:hypothetical protein
MARKNSREKTNTENLLAVNQAVFLCIPWLILCVI